MSHRADASQLLSLLRAGGPPSTSQPAQSTSKLSTGTATSTAEPDGASTAANPAAELERLFRSAFSTPHPSHATSHGATEVNVPQPRPQIEPQRQDDGIRRAANDDRSSNSTILRGHAGATAAAAASSAVPLPGTTAPVPSSTPHRANHGSVSLLSLLQRMSSPPTSSAPAIPSPSSVVPPSPSERPGAMTAQPSTYPSPPSSKTMTSTAKATTTAASQSATADPTSILGKLWGINTLPSSDIAPEEEDTSSISRPTKALTLEEVERAALQTQGSDHAVGNGGTHQMRKASDQIIEAEDKKQEKAATAGSGPNFGALVSPFELLAQAHATELRHEQDGAVYPKARINVETSEADDQPTPRPASAAPPSLPSSSTHPTSRQQQKASDKSGNDSSEGQASTATRAPLDLLVKKYLSDTPSQAPKWAPRGLQLPPRRRSIAPPVAQHLTIDISAPNLDSLDSGAQVETTPVVLFDVPSEWSPGRRSALSSHVFVWSTSKGRIRIVDRRSGAKILLKGHKSAIADLSIAPAPDADGSRMITSIGTDGRLIVYNVPNSFSQDTVPTHKALELEGSALAEGAKFRSARFHPQFPSVPRLALLLGSSCVTILHLERARMPEVAIESAVRTAHCGAEVVSICFSPDGTAFAVLTVESGVTIRKTSAPEKILWSRPPKSPGFDGARATEIAFLTTSNGRPAGLVLAARDGTHLQLVSLSHDGYAVHDTNSIEFTLSVEGAEAKSCSNFAHLFYHQPSTTLFVSSSARGSLFAFRIGVDESESHRSAPDCDLLAHRSELTEPRVEHVAEIATAEPVVEFSVDKDISGPPSSETPSLSTLIAHPGGLHAVTFDFPGLAVGKGRGHDSGDEDELYGEPGRRMSLEGSIRVESEVEVVVDVVETTACSPHSRLAANLKLKAPIQEEPGSVSAEAPQVSSHDGPDCNIYPSKGSHDDLKGLISQPSAPARAQKVAKPAPGAPGVSRELRKVEDRITKAIQQEMQVQAHQAAEERANDRTADVARQETLLKLVLSALSKKLDVTVREQMRAQVIPSMSKLVTASINEQVARGIEEGMSETLPRELRKLLSRPEMSSHIAQSVSAAIIPSISGAVERQLLSIVATGVIPGFNSSLASAIEGMMQSVHDTVHAEMTDVRKEIVQEQSGAIVELETLVGDLKEEVSELKTSLVRMEQLVLSLCDRLSVSPGAAAPSRQSTASTSRQASSSQTQPHPPPQQATHAQTQWQPSSFGAFSAFARPQASDAKDFADEDYEEMFTDALQPQHAPDFADLLGIIGSSPPARAERVFPPAPLPPRISPPVVLSLAYQLAGRLSGLSGPINDEARKHLLWIRKCLSAMDSKAEEVREFVPKVIETVIVCLHARADAIAASHDRRGLDELRAVESFAHSQLKHFVG
ncbi:BQ2448_5847 [Microbotryum intermedium]|uniref:BQ2448_5847 protein n=1 Tax=Microbotryum intermedium TaxID=269621 RepID=A0A238F5H2_9BASI|nr:BQ2448_5847 [Microbotryum intermedium]